MRSIAVTHSRWSDSAYRGQLSRSLLRGLRTAETQRKPGAVRSPPVAQAYTVLRLIRPRG
jgi:hypothetical protein